MCVGGLAEQLSTLCSRPACLLQTPPLARPELFSAPPPTPSFFSETERGSFVNLPGWPFRSEPQALYPHASDLLEDLCTHRTRMGDAVNCRRGHRWPPGGCGRSPRPPPFSPVEASARVSLSGELSAQGGVGCALPVPCAGGSPVLRAGGSPVLRAGGSPVPSAGGSPVPHAGGSPVPCAGGSPGPRAAAHLSTSLPAARGCPAARQGVRGVLGRTPCPVAPRAATMCASRRPAVLHRPLSLV